MEVEVTGGGELAAECHGRSEADLTAARDDVQPAESRGGGRHGAHRIEKGE